MADYKIIDDFKELSDSDLQKNKDFGRIHKNVVSAKQTALKMLVLKFAIASGVLGIITYVVVQRIDNRSTSANHTVHKESNTPIVFKDSSEIDKKNVYSTAPVVIKPVIKRTANSPDSDSLKKELIKQTSVVGDPMGDETVNQSDSSLKKNIGQGKIRRAIKITPDAECYLVKTNCTNPMEMSAPPKWICNRCEFDFMDCTQLPDSLAFVLVTLKNENRLKLKSKFENIELIDSKTDQSIRPVGVGIGEITKGGTMKIITGKFKTKNFTLEYEKGLALIVIFPKASPGDHLIIRGVLQVEIVAKDKAN